jgi:hypothetical protein
MEEMVIKRFFRCPICGTAVWTARDKIWCCDVKHEFPGPGFPIPTTKTEAACKVRQTRDVVKNPCIYRGQWAVDLVECNTCVGKTKVKVFECELYQLCTLKKNVGQGKACCVTCGSYSPVQPAVS